MEQGVETVRPGSITAASILLFIFGVLSLLGGFLVLVGYAALAELGIDVALGSLVAMGVLSVIFGLGEIIAGAYLWGCYKFGGWLGLGICIVSLAPAALFFDPVVTPLSVFLALVIIALIASGWKSLK